MLGRLKISTLLLTDLSQGGETESSKADAIKTSDKLEYSPEAPIKSVQAP